MSPKTQQSSRLQDGSYPQAQNNIRRRTSIERRHRPVGVEYEQRQQQQTSKTKGAKDRVYAPLRPGALENAIGNRRKEIARPDQYNVITPCTL